MKKALLIAALFGAVSLIAACGSSGGSGGGGESQGAALDGPEATVAVFKSNCISCHGTDLKGKMGPNTDLTSVGAKMTRDEIEKQIKDGSAKMPGFGKMLKEDEIAGLADWLATKGATASQ